jgi:phospholipid/cholesterol/gamma-HCH transport system permease protein
MFRDILNSSLEFVRTFGAFQLFFLRLLQHSPTIFYRRFGLVVKQVYNAGALSIVFIMVCGFFVGGGVGFEGYSNMGRFNPK